MKRLFAAITLSVVLSFPVIAGEIPIGDFLPPPPQTNGTSGSQSQDVSVATPAIDESTASQELLDTFVVSIVSFLMR